jgi:hypothetical protein
MKENAVENNQLRGQGKSAQKINKALLEFNS